MRLLTATVLGSVGLAGVLLAGCSSGSGAPAVEDAALAPSGSAAASAQPSAPSSSAAGLEATPRPNNVSLVIDKSSTAGSSVTFAWDGQYSISPGQEGTWQGVTGCTAGPGSTCKVTVTAGRYGTATPCQWWDQLGVTYIAAQPFTKVSCGNAQDWNFAITGTLEVTASGKTASYPVAFGQTGGGGNQWILGGIGSDWENHDPGPDYSGYAMATTDGVLAAAYEQNDEFVLFVE